MTPLETRTHVEPHSHAVLVYDEEDDLLMPLSHFLAEGEQVQDLSVFVHSFAGNDEARAFLQRGALDVHRRERSGSLTNARYIESFERNGHIDHDQAASVVQMLETTARTTGRRAPRIFVDASKNYLSSGRRAEWFALERWLGPRLSANAGLVCAYRASDLRDPEVLALVLETHAYRFDGPSASP